MTGGLPGRPAAALRAVLQATLLAVLTLCCAPLWAAPCPAAVPAGLSATPVGSDLVSSGLAMTITQVGGKETPAAILDRTEQSWKAAGLDVRRGSAAGWQVLSVKGEHCLLTLQLVARDGSFGYLARSKPAPSSVSAASMGVPLPPDARVASTVASDDDGRKSVVLAARSGMSMEQLAQFFMQQLAGSDWSATRSHRITDRKRGVSTLFVTAQRDRRQVEIVIWPDQGSQIVMTVADAL